MTLDDESDSNRRILPNPPLSNPEPYLTVKDAAAALCIPEWKLQRAVRDGTVPSYSFFNRRRLVRLSEVIAVIEASRQGGSDV